MSKTLAWLWLLLVLGSAGWLFGQRNTFTDRLDADLFGLLPHDERDQLAEAAMSALSTHGERQLVVLLGHRDPEQAINAARVLREALQRLPLKSQDAGIDLQALRDFYTPFSRGLASSADLLTLRSAGADDWIRRGLGNAYAPFSASGLAWKDDPFGLYGNWLAGQAELTRVRPRDGWLMLDQDAMHYVVMPYTLSASAFSLDVQTAVADGLQQGIEQARTQVPDISVQRAGIVLHAASAAKIATREMSTIGLGSTLGVVILVMLVFRGWRALPLVALSIVVGTMMAVAASFALFSHVHVLTLVFGASLVGIAEDYSLHALAASIDATDTVRARFRQLLPGMTLALVTTVVAYLGLMLTPFPGFVQMAVFSSVGITAAWITVMLWFPHLAPQRIRATRMAHAIGSLLPRWPHLSWRRHGWWLLLLAIPTVVGLYRLQTNDDVRALSGADPTLVHEQIAVSKLLGLASPAQLFVVSGTSPEIVLQREEALRAELDPFVARGELSGYDGISRWLPSVQHQNQIAQVQREHIFAAPGVLERIAQELGLADDWVVQQRATATPLAFPMWFAAIASTPSRHLWLGESTGGEFGSMVLLQGLSSRETAERLADIHLPGVRWMDKPAEFSVLLQRYRRLLTVLLAIGYVVTAVSLWFRYRGDTWRALVPPIVATVLTLALLGLVGAPMQMLTMLSLLLLLGMGVDYGIFLLEHPGDQRAFLAVSVAAITTLLSFGLLAFSSTPALHAFGLATLFGIGLVWLIAPFFRKQQIIGVSAHD